MGELVGFLFFLFYKYDYNNIYAYICVSVVTV